jgi:glycosyltransferase involved in cell wall biosynthesis
LKLCLISNQIAAWGKIGGFGTATRALGSGLAGRGVEVSAVVVRRPEKGQGPLEKLDGMTVYGPSNFKTLTSGRIFRQIDADIYQSQEPTIATYFAQRAMPDRVHVVTCRDPRDWHEHAIELKHTNLKRRLMFPATWYYEVSPWVKKSVRGADAVLMPAPSALVSRIQQLYGSGVEPEFVPYPVEVPDRPPQKAAEPTLLFVGRFDHRKRMERFFELAKEYPHLRFIAVGEAHDKRYDQHLRNTYGHLPNLEMPGFVSRFGERTVSEYYEKAWILVNTSAREGLPYTFMEAAAYGVAILSALDPEEFASRFGYFAANDDFEEGLDKLLKNDLWRERGAAGARFVAATWNEDNCLNEHLRIYRELLGRKASGTMSTRPRSQL